jgi:hypothetical protein
MLSISTIPSIPVCRQAGIRGLSNGVKLLLRHEAIWMRLLSLYMTAHRRMGKEVEKL